MPTQTFTLRVNPQDHKALVRLAALQGKPAAELAREFIAEGLQRALDTKEINTTMDEEDPMLEKASKNPVRFG